nr:hypothetical protein [Tanacetum cinerariifolium]
MSLASSAVTYTSVYTDSKLGRVFWGADEELSDGEYVAESDPEDPEEFEDDETEDGPVDYPIDEEDNGDDDDSDSSRDDTDDKDEDEEDEEEEEHLALTDSTVVIPTDELVSPPEGTEPVIPLPSTYTATTGARITVRLQAAISFPPEAEVKRLLAMSTPSPSPLALLSPPSAGERLARCTTQDVSPLPPPLHMPPPIDHYRFVSTLDAEARRRGIREVGYGIRNTWVDPTKTVPEIAPMTVGEVNTRVIELFELHEHDTQDLYALLEDPQDSRTRISQQVTMDSQRLQTHQTQLQLQSTLFQTKHQLHETRFQMQQTEIAELRETGRMHQAQMVETLRVMGDMRREMGDM